MFDQILSIIAPHRCYECGKTGYILCQSCKKYIIKQRFQLCILCGNPLKTGNLCDNHQQPYDMLWCFGYRRGSIAKIIDDYKFRRVQAAAGVLGDLLDSALPELSYRLPRRLGICAAAVTTICGLSPKIWPGNEMLAILPCFVAAIMSSSTPPGRRVKESGKLKSSSRYPNRLIQRSCM